MLSLGVAALRQLSGLILLQPLPVLLLYLTFLSAFHNTATHFPPERQHALRSTCSARRYLAILSSPFCPIQLSTSILLLKLESHPFAFGFSCNFYVKKFVLFYEKNLFRGRPLSSRSTYFLFLSVLVPAFLRTPTFTPFFDISLRDISSSSPSVQHPDHRLLQTTSQVFLQIMSKSRVHIQPFIQIVSINL